MQVRPEDLEAWIVAAFNSLFEMQLRDQATLALACLCSLSILYLRCPRLQAGRRGAGLPRLSILYLRCTKKLPQT